VVSADLKENLQAQVARITHSMSVILPAVCLLAARHAILAVLSVFSE